MNEKCPWCESEENKVYIALKDLFLSKKNFQIHECTNCGLLYTMPRPDKEKIGDYYKSNEYYSHQENKKGFIPRLYEAIKKVNVNNKYKMATKGLAGDRLLDIGCGVGDFLHIAEKHGWDCIGVEPSMEAKAIAKKRINANIIESEDLNTIGDETFDLITMWHVLEHVDDLKWQVEQLQRLVKPKGRIVIAVPNYKSYDGQYYKEFWAAYDVPRHLNHFNKNTITQIFKSQGLELKKTEKLVWDAYYISYMSEQYKQKSLPLIRGAYRGFISNIKARSSGEWSSLVYIFEKKKQN